MSRTAEDRERLAAAISNGDDATPTMTPILTCLAGVAAKPVHWLWRGRLALGKLTMLIGAPGDGKSTVAADIAARVSTGAPWPDDGERREPGSVLLVATEDDAADTIRPRLDACRGDPSRVYHFTTLRVGERERLLSLADIDVIEAAMSEIDNCKLLVIDPIDPVLGDGVDAHRANEVYSLLTPLAKLAERRGVAVMIVKHTRKGAAGTADERVMGSRAFVGIARVVLHLMPDAGDKRRKLLLPGKINVGPPSAGLAFRIVGDDGAASPAWEREPVDMDATAGYDALSAVRAAADRGEAGDDDDGAIGPELMTAMIAVARMLKDGPRPTAEVDKDARAAGVSAATLRRAKESLGLKPYKLDNKWTARLPRDGENNYIIPDAVRDAIAEADAEMAELAEPAGEADEAEPGDEPADATAILAEPAGDAGEVAGPESEPAGNPAGESQAKPEPGQEPADDAGPDRLFGDNADASLWYQ